MMDFDAAFRELHLVSIPWHDWAAIILLLVLWQGTGWYIEDGPRSDRSTQGLMVAHRRQWMVEMGKREVRIVDSALLVSLQNGSAFFASAGMLAAGGVVALMGQTEQLRVVASDLPMAAQATPPVWHARLATLLGLLIYSVFKFAWGHRLFSYNAILIGATPAYDDPDSAAREAMVERAAITNIRAARSFNRGLRALYFALGGLGWLFGPLGLAAGALLVTWSLYRREFRSVSRRAVAKAL